MVRPILTTADVAHLPRGTNVYVALYKNLKNCRYLRKQLVEQNHDFEYAFIDARKVLSTTHLLAAVFRAVNDQNVGKMKSHNVHSEIVVSLNTTNNIGDALRKFGISDQTSNLLVVKVTTTQDANGISAQLEHAVEAEPLEFNDAELAKVHDLTEIRKIYKIHAPTANTGSQDSASQSENSSSRAFEDLQMAILGSIALRGAT